MSAISFGVTLYVSQPTELTSNTKYERNPSIFEAADGEYWLFYARADTLTNRTGSDVDDENYMIYHTTSGDGGVSWSPPTLLNKTRPNGINFTQRDISAFQDSSGTIWVFASSGDSGTCRHIVFYKSSDGGITWSNATPVFLPGTSNDSNCIAPLTGTRLGHSHVIYADGTIYLVFQSSGGSAIRFSSSTDGVTWSTVKEIYTSGMYVPKLAYINNTFYLVTAQGATGQIWIANTTDPGGYWTNRSIAGSGVPWTDWDPTITVLPNGTLLLVWSPNVGADGQQLKLSYSTDAGSTWSSSRNITAGKYGSTEWWDYWPAILNADGQTLIFYTSEQDPTGRAYDGGHIWLYNLTWNLDSHHYAAIQQAINSSNHGDIINVSPGVYIENVTINKNLSLAGANAGIDARMRASGDVSGESLVNGTVSFSGITNINFDGFTVTSASDRTGILADSRIKRIVNTIVEYVCRPIFVHFTNGSSFIQYNVLRHSYTPASCVGAPGTGIYLENDNYNLTIDSNDILDMNYSAVIITGTPEHITVSNNYINGTWDQGINIYSTAKNVTIKNNYVTRTNIGNGSDKGGIRFYAPDDVFVFNNTITDSYNGFCVRTGSDITGKHITVYNSTVKGNSNAGAYNAGTGTLDLRFNYWGDMTGPYYAGGGSGDAIIGDLLFNPFYIDSDYLHLSTEFPPVIQLNQPAENQHLNSSTIQLNFTATSIFSSDNINCSLYLDGILNQTNQSTFNNTATVFSVSGVGEGNHNWSINCTDRLNNSNISETRNFTVDLAPPTIVIQSPANLTYHAPSVALSYTVLEGFAVDSCWYVLDGNPAVMLPGCANTTITSLGNGPHNLRVYANDSGGNENFTDVIFSISLPADDGNPSTSKAKEFSLSFQSTCNGSTVTVSGDGGRIEGAKIYVMNDDTLQYVASGYTDDQGRFSFQACGFRVRISISANGFHSYSTARSLVDCGVCVLPECVTDDDCADDEYCSQGVCVPVFCDCGGIENHQCVVFECCTDTDCANGLVCEKNVCLPPVSGCTADSDCGSAQYCDIPAGTVWGICTDITGCGEIVDHELIPYECGDNCPACPEGTICENHVCVRSKLECPPTVDAGDDMVCSVMAEGWDCTDCEYILTDPNGKTRTGTFDEDGNLRISHIDVPGTWFVTLLKNGTAVKTVAITVTPRAASGEQPLMEVIPGVGIYSLVSLLIVIIIMLGIYLLWKRRKRK